MARTLTNMFTLLSSPLRRLPFVTITALCCSPPTCGYA